MRLVLLSLVILLKFSDFEGCLVVVFIGLLNVLGIGRILVFFCG